MLESGNESERRKGKGLVLQSWGLGIAAILESGAGAKGGAQGVKNRLDWVGFPRFFTLGSKVRGSRDVHSTHEQHNLGIGFQAQVQPGPARPGLLPERD